MSSQQIVLEGLVKVGEWKGREWVNCLLTADLLGGLDKTSEWKRNWQFCI